MLSLPDQYPHVLINLDGVVQHVSLGAAQLLDVESESLKGKIFAQIFQFEHTQHQFKRALDDTLFTISPKLIWSPSEPDHTLFTVSINAGQRGTRHIRISLVPHNNLVHRIVVMLHDLTHEYRQVATLKSASDFAEHLQKQLTSGFIRCTREGDLIEIDDELLQKLDCTRDQLRATGLGNPKWRLVNKWFERIDTIRALITLLLQKKNTIAPSDIIGVYRPVDKAYHWYQVLLLSEEPDSTSDSTTNYRLLFRDINDLFTASSTIQREQEQVFQVAQAMQEGIWVVDVNTQRNLFLNNAFTKMFNIRFEIDFQNTLSQVGDLISSEKSQSFQQWVNDVQNNLRKPSFEGFLVNPSGQTQWFRFTGFLNYSSFPETTQQLIIIVTDITAQQELLRQIDAARLESEYLSRLKSNVIANVSHEFRTPLTAILGFIALVREMNVSSDILELLIPVETSTYRLHHTLSSILHFAQLDAKALRLQENHIQTHHFAQKLHNDIAPIALEKDIVFEHFVWGLPSFIADEASITLICRELLFNALKFTHSGYVGFYLFADTRKVHLFVYDTGIGLNPDNLEALMEPFRQGSEGLSRAYEGMGLGLSIVKRTLHHLGGTLRSASNQPKGSLFHISIPVTVSQTQTIDKPAMESETKKRILYTEDNMLLQNLLKLLLPEHEIIGATSGEDALLTLKHNSFDMFMIDINLGSGMNGIELCTKIRQDPMYRNTPILALTATEHDKILPYISNSMFTEYIKKPFHPNEIRQIVKFQLSSRSGVTDSELLSEN